MEATDLEVIIQNDFDKLDEELGGRNVKCDSKYSKKN